MIYVRAVGMYILNTSSYDDEKSNAGSWPCYTLTKDMSLEHLL